MSSFCDQAKQQAAAGAGGTSGKNGLAGKKGGCGCNGAAGVKYEPLSWNWLKENAGVITLFVTVIILIANRG